MQNLQHIMADIASVLDAHNHESARRSTFDGRVADLEPLCRGVFDAWRAGRSHSGPERESREWYAMHLLREIADVREARARGDVELALSKAVVVGALAADADARHNWRAVQLGIKSIEKTQSGGRAHGKQITEDAEQLSREIRQTIERYKSSDTRLSIRKLAKDLGTHERTIQRHLKKLNLTLPKF